MITSQQPPAVRATILPILAGVEWPSAAVAIALIGFLAFVMYMALRRYTMDEVLKLWAALGTIAGIIVGTFGTYFFTREATQAKVQIAQAQREAVETQLNTLKAASDAVKTKLSPKDAEWFDKMIYSGTPTGHGTTPETPRPKSKFQYQIYRGAETATPTP